MHAAESRLPIGGVLYVFFYLVSGPLENDFVLCRLPGIAWERFPLFHLCRAFVFRPGAESSLSVGFGAASLQLSECQALGLAFRKFTADSGAILVFLGRRIGNISSEHRFVRRQGF